MPKTDLPPSAREWRFIRSYSHDRCVYKAAESVGMDRSEGPKLYRRLRPHIDKVCALIDREMARISARANLVSVELADSELLRAAKGPLGQPKVRALELLYERLGMRRDGNFIGPPAAETHDTPNVYRALERTTVRTEQIVEREVSAISPGSPANQPQLPQGATVIEGEIPAPKQPSFQILDY